MSAQWTSDERAMLEELGLPQSEWAAVLEEHRQLEKDLLRLADPLPPGDFVAQVMDRVATAPPRPVTGKDIALASFIFTVAVGVAGFLVFTTGPGSGTVGLVLAELAVRFRDGLVAMGSGLVALWTTAALPLAVGLIVTVGLSLLALRRVGVGQPPSSKVLT